MLKKTAKKKIPQIKLKRKDAYKYNSHRNISIFGIDKKTTKL